MISMAAQNEGHYIPFLLNLYFKTLGRLHCLPFQVKKNRQKIILYFEFVPKELGKILSIS